MAYLRLITAKLPVAVRKTLQVNGELDITTTHNVLNLKLGELGIEAEFLHNPRVLARRQPRIVLRFCTSDDHLARGKDKRGGFRIANSHDDGRETLCDGKREKSNIHM
jgi:hypothetical protein